MAATAEVRMRAAQGSRPSGASAQRISDWKAGRNVPARFESLLPVVLTLVESARKAGNPLPRALAEPKEWQRVWRAATTWSPDEDDEAACPYPGLSAYRREDHALFFGRVTATGELSALVREATGPVVVLGASGVGKSSLLAAGVLPALSDWEITTLTPGARPHTALPDLAARRDGPHRLLVVDQFEELFTTCDDEASREEFLAALHECATRTADPLTVVIALRADFYTRCLNYPVLRDALEHRSYPLGPMRMDELAQAISGPASAVGLELEPGLEELVITELCATGDHHGRRGYDPGALPLLAHVMAATWQHREGRRLTVIGYRKAGGVVGSVADTAENAWNELTLGQQAAAKTILLGLVAVGQDTRDTRRPGNRADLIRRAGDSESAETALELLSRTRLITLDADSVTLTHEIVLTAWPRLRSWIDEDRVGYLVRQRLETDASEWLGQERDPSLLYRGTRLRTALDTADAAPAGTLAHEFLTAADTADRKSRRRSRRTKLNSAFLGIGLLIMGAGVYNQTRLADQRADDKTFASVLAEADRVQQTDPSLTAQMNLVAWRMRPGDNEVRSRLLQSQTEALVTVTPGHPQVLVKLGYQPDGKILASLASDHGLRLWNSTDPRHPQQLGRQLDGVDDFAFAAGQLLVTDSSADGSPRAVTLWDISTPATPRPLATIPELPDTGNLRIATTSDGHTLAISTRTHLALWNVSDPRAPVLSALRPLRAAGTSGDPGDIRFSPNGRLLAVVSTDDSTKTTAVQLWDVRNPAAPTQPTPAVDTPADLTFTTAFSPDGTLLATGGGSPQSIWGTENPGVRLWDVRDASHPRQLTSVRTDNTIVHALEFAPDAATLVISGNRGSTVWNVTDPADPHPLLDKLTTRSALCHFGPMTSQCIAGPNALAITPDGRELVTGGFSGDLQVWSLPSAVTAAYAGRGVPPAFAAGGTRMATTARSGLIELWDLRNPGPPKRIGEYRAESDNVVPGLTPEGNTLIIFDVPTGRVRTLDISDPAHPHPVGDWTPPAPESRGIKSISENHRLMATARDDTFQLWDLSDPVRPQPVGTRLPLGEQGGPLLGPDNTLLMARMDGKADERQLVVELWDIKDPARPQRISELFREPAALFQIVALSDDKRTMVTTDNERVQLWDISSPTKPVPLSEWLTAHTVPIVPFGLTTDNHTLFDVGVDGTLQRWDISDRAHPARTTVLNQSMNFSGDAALSPDQHHIASVSSEGTVHLWDLDEHHAIDRICALTGTLWTEALWHAYLPQLPYHPPC
ncbi:hypothetical protein GPX89_16540 [Nocardia sp. ET3-3]|uniref:Novel STAND NTPase 1 domain-containing protein n=1 Tax=Nocardia terrae TaxID=2675851 RepID=A0A7K1UY63_9NOCA|nr:WD40 repeat domain-containing protein [Nocardia terrae]MVU78848.1 hypothetical protein [Nocardia terrae]